MSSMRASSPTKISDWVDSMRASSPAKSPPSSPERDSWMVTHPSALEMFDNIIKASKGKKIVMFLDYDGTLSPIVQDPERAFMSEEIFFDDSVRNVLAGNRIGMDTVLVGTSHRPKGVDYALESIHNLKEALPKLWKSEVRVDVNYSEKISRELTSVVA